MSVASAREQLDAFGRERAAFWAGKVPRGTCPGCGQEDAILYQSDGGVCAECVRRASVGTGVHKDGYPCDDCGEAPAFRDPLHRRDEMKCQGCHEKDGYVPGERAMVTRMASREGVTHSKGRREMCSLASGAETRCRGQVKQRGRHGLICDWHWDPKAFLNLVKLTGGRHMAAEDLEGLELDDE